MVKLASSTEVWPHIAKLLGITTKRVRRAEIVLDFQDACVIRMDVLTGIEGEVERQEFRLVPVEHADANKDDEQSVLSGDADNSAELLPAAADVV